jgi:hypothetical protein
MTAVSEAGSGTGRGIRSMMTVSGMITQTVGQEAKAKKPKTNKLKGSHPLQLILASQLHFNPLNIKCQISFFELKNVNIELFLFNLVDYSNRSLSPKLEKAKAFL